MTTGPFPATRFRRLEEKRRPAPTVAGERAFGERPDLAGLRHGRAGRRTRDSLDARSRAADHRPRGAAAEEAATLGIPAICLFPYTDPALKTEACEEAWNPDNLSNRAVRAIKAAVPEIAVMTDVALDPYNANGHDGLVRTARS
jgi:porphobilinogen synthase